MLAWIIANLATLGVCLLLLAAAALVVAALVRNRRQGKCSCGCSRADCPQGDSCHHGK